MDPENGLLTFHLLGKPSISYGADSLGDLLAGKEQALLAYLACQPGKRFSRDHLATLLWGETSPDRTRYNLRRALWRLRSALEEVGLPPDACLATDDSWVSIPDSAPTWTDVLEFEDAFEAASHRLEAQFSPTSEGVRRIREALDLYRGEFMAGFAISQAPDFEHWVLVERERLFQLLLRALTTLIQSFIAWGRRDEGIKVCQRLLELDPLQEDIHRLLMRLYWDTGRRTQALRQYRSLEKILRRELDIEPVQETQELYERILKQEISPTSISSLTLTSRLTLPTPAEQTLPRPRLFALLDRGLEAPLTLVSAPPGYGKTTLLAQWVEARAQEGAGPEVLFAWYRLSEADNAPLTLVEGLVTSLARQHPGLGDALQEIYDLAGLQGDPRRAVSLLVNALTGLSAEPFAMILDDVGLATNPDSVKVLEFLVRHLPRNGHLYLLTRVDPQLPLARLRVRGRLVEIRVPELRFSEEETVTFLERTPGAGLSAEEIETLTRLAEGWAAPLWMAVSGRSQFAASLDDVWKAIFAYLRQEVLVPQPVDVGDFLLRSGILNEVIPSVCQAVTERAEGVKAIATRLDRLVNENLFLRRLGPLAPEKEPRYGYHPLFHRFLRTELPYHISEAEIAELHRRAAEAWARYGDADEAFYHRQRLEDLPSSRPSESDEAADTPSEDGI
jgi:DNA-binding SARP family transcriptional activator